MSSTHSNIESILQEKRVFQSPPHLAKRAWIKSREQYEQMYRESIDSPEKFWEKIASELHWRPLYDFDRGLEQTVGWYLENLAWCDAVRAGRYAGERLGLASRTL